MRTSLEQEHAGAGTGPLWPLLSAVELRRLRFLAYCRATGRIRPAASVRAEVEILCASLLSGRQLPGGTSSERRAPPPRGASGVPPFASGLPPLWQAWVERQR
jgi:hypothetical protein